MKEKQTDAGSPGYQFFMLVLCLYALGQMGVQAMVQLDPGTQAILEAADFVVCIVFLIDFGINFFKAPNRLHYLVTWGWIDLLSSVPSLDVARWGRLGRVLRVLRVLRGLRVTRSLSALILRRRAENTFLAVTLVALLVLVFGSVAILQLETDPDSNIRNAEDAIWWAITTMTTVGYGDRFPVTMEGRVVACLLMAAGVGLFGTFSGFLAIWLIGPPLADEATGLENLRLEVAALREAIERAGIVQPQKPPGEKE